MVDNAFLSNATGEHTASVSSAMLPSLPPPRVLALLPFLGLTARLAV